MKGTTIRPKQQQGHKYHINVLLKKLPQEVYETAKDELCKRLNITRVQLWRILTTKIDSNSSATSDQLMEIVKYLSQYMEVTLDDLINKSEP